MDKNLFVQNVKKACNAKGIKPAVALRESGLDKSFISNIEARGSIPSVEKVQRLAAYLGVTTSELLGEEKEPTPVIEDGLNAEQTDLVRLYDAAPPALRAAALAVLKSAEEQNTPPGGAATDE